MNTTTSELLAPYASAILRLSEGTHSTLVAEALILREAAHVAEVRAEQGEPVGGWKNARPLEHATMLGWYIRELRTGKREPVLQRASDGEFDAEKTELARTLLNCENIIAPANWHQLTTDDLIAYTAAEIFLA